MRKCENCGAPLQVTDRSTECSFCGTEHAPEAVVATVVTVEVDTTVAASAEQVPRCGRGHLGLLSMEVGGVELRGCAECGGVWLDNAAAQRVLASADRVFSDLAWRIGRRARHPQPTVQARPACPTCGKPLRVVEFMGFVVDVCAAHGTWFDPFELSKIVAAVREKNGKMPPSPPVACVTCGKQVPASQTMQTERGPECDACSGARLRSELAKVGPLDTSTANLLMWLHGPEVRR